MNMNDTPDLEHLLDDLDGAEPALLGQPELAPAPPRRALPQLMRKIPVTLTLEVGEAKISLHELAQLGADSVVELDTLAGEPLTLKVNGATIGRAEVVVSGDNYALKVIDIAGLDLEQLQP
ncbi:FliM/FliN family flagellar motor switch protein [Paucibacter sediminis]|uniref:Flagellar motor switch protein FliN n=1 Tax=Paucibacter sediminis TaxID=3019553 RepID=A0AA95SKS6_9BURK|nr:FliM/FliN family flagellar motor switch protein [Paucibacter sp. S2-9]WIT11408.1 FliM/FliN family flagellar motor switch protein [Paucibacter sp. S2-9]